jgi:hypothetical protein
VTEYCCAITQLLTSQKKLQAGLSIRKNDNERMRQAKSKEKENYLFIYECIYFLAAGEIGEVCKMWRSRIKWSSLFRWRSSGCDSLQVHQVLVTLSVYLVMSTTLKVFVVSPDTHSERRFDSHTTIGQLKVAYSPSYAMITL